VTEHTIWIDASRGRRLSATLSPASGDDRGVVMVHGGPGGSQDGPGDLFIKLAADLARKNIGSLRFDMLGEGSSDGDHTDVTLGGQADQLAGVLRFARGAALFAQVTVAAESLGAASLLLQAEWPSELRAAVLLWPALEPEQTSLSEYLTPERLREAASNGFIVVDGLKVSQTFLHELMTIGNLTDHLSHMLVPMLLIHGDADQEVPVAQSLSAREQLLAQSRTVIVPGGEHGLRRPKEQAQVRREVVQWCIRHMPPTT
jgi:fermentation-respiration switch protein FrsA (DUF1100 family)